MAACIGLSPSVSAAGDPFLGYDGPVYPNPVTPTVVAGNWGMLQGDFNEDGREDLVIVSTGFNILLGNGDCTFTLSAVPIFGRSPAVVGDFNEDNHQDLAVADTGNGVEMIFGNGDGTFGPPAVLTVPTVPITSYSWGLAAADFNGDNHDDLVMGFRNGGPLAFFSGNGDGTFEAATTFGNSIELRGIGVADFDENGNLDLIVIGQNTGTAQVYLGGGNGTFAGAGAFAVGNGPITLLVFDFNGDGHADFATVEGGSDGVSVLLGNGDGTFAAETQYTVGIGAVSLTVADVDGDGNGDLFVGHLIDEFVSLLPGNSDGTFGAEIQIATAHSSGWTVIADFDDDGRLDLATGGMWTNEVAIFRGRGDGTFDGLDPALVRSDGASGVLTAAFGDVNTDGLQDAVLLRDAGTNSIEVRVADGTGAFITSASDAAGTGPSDVAIADLNNDTHPDVIATNFGSNDASILLGNGDGTFAPVFQSPAIRDPVSIATGLFNDDINVDLAVLSTFPAPAIHVLFGNGDATFSQGGMFPVGPGAYVVETGDFDENEEIDLVVLNFDSSDASVLLGVGDGTFQPEVRYGVQLFSTAPLSIADVDSDGHQDLIVNTRVLYGAGDGTFGAATPLAVSMVGDANGDGRTDLINVGVRLQVYLQLRQADGSFGEGTFFSSGSNPNGIAILDDTNGDGRNDVIVATSVGVTALLNVEPAVFNFLNDKITLRWPDVDGALSYNVYRGLLSDLVDGDSDGLPDMGYGDCQNTMDPDTTDLQYVDASVPGPNSGYFYLIAVEDWAGERFLGTTSDGFPRVPTLPCP